MPGHGGKLPDGVFLMAIGILAFLIAESQGSYGSGLCHGGRHGELRFVAVERALHGIFRGYVQRLRVALVLNEVSLIIGHVRTIVDSGAAAGRMWNDGKERLREQFTVRGEPD